MPIKNFDPKHFSDASFSPSALGSILTELFDISMASFSPSAFGSTSTELSSFLENIRSPKFTEYATHQTDNQPISLDFIPLGSLSVKVWPLYLGSFTSEFSG